jgi:hypothetical protein
VARRVGVSLNAVQYNVSWMRRHGVDVPGRKNHSSRADDHESRSEARERVARGVTDGSRCPRCHLLKPCDHG